MPCCVSETFFKRHGSTKPELLAIDLSTFEGIKRLCGTT